MSEPAVFLDRDDTLIVDTGFVDDPEKVRLVPGAADAVKSLHQSGFKVIIASNQSGIARGLFDEARLDEIHDRIQELLARQGTSLDGIYYCPFLDGPEAVVERFRRNSDLRKPAPGMLLRAAKEMDLDLRRSWMIGDSSRDIQAGHRAGCRTILITTNGQESANGETRPTAVAPTLVDAAEIVRAADPPTVAGPSIARSPSAASGSTVAAGSTKPAGKARPGKTRPAEPAAESSRATLDVLTEIRDVLVRQHRDKLQEDFSLIRLLATLMQMLAVFMAAWGGIALLGDGPPMSAVARISLAVFLQLAIVTMKLGNPRS